MADGFNDIIVSSSNLVFPNGVEIKELANMVEFNNVFRQDILDALHMGEVLVDFTKADGTKRQMRCTLTNIPADKLPSGNRPANDTPTKINVFDLDKQAWRSFNLDRVSRVEWVWTNGDGEIFITTLEADDLLP